MARLVAIDWLGFARPIALSVNSPRYQWSFPKTQNYELQEIALRIFKQLFSMKEIYGWSGGIVAADHRGNYWRNGRIAEFYANTAIKAKAQDGSTYLFYDNGIYHISPDGVFNPKALPGKEYPKEEILVPFCEGLDEFGNPDTVYWTKVGDEEKQFLPKYKGGRAKQTWMLTTPPDTFFKALENMRKWAAQLLGLAAVGAEGMEADDLCAWASTMASESWPVDVVTRDSDCHQLAARNPNVRILDMGQSCNITHDMSNEILVSLCAKLIGGDTSDNIKGLSKGARGCYGKDAAIKLARKFTGSTHSELRAYMESLGNDPKIAHNWEMVVLPNEGVKEICMNAIMAAKPQPPEKDWEFFGITKQVQENLRSAVFAQEFVNLFVADGSEMLG